MPVFLPEVRPFASVWKVFLFWLCLFIHCIFWILVVFLWERRKSLVVFCALDETRELRRLHYIRGETVR